VTAVLISTAEGVKDALAAAPIGTFNQQFTPVRSYADFELPLKKVTKLLVDCVPSTAPKTELDDSESVKFQPFVDVLIRQRFSIDAQDEDTGKIELDRIDALVELTEQIHRFLTKHRLEDFEDAVCEIPQLLVAFSPTHLRQFRQYTSIVRVPFSANIDL
jgi:hypothetical protein